MTRTGLPILAAVAAFVAASVIAFAPSVGADGGIGDVEFHFTPATVPPGGTMHVSGSCGASSTSTTLASSPPVFADVYAFLPGGAPVPQSSHTQTFPVEPDGSFGGPFVIPPSSTPGSWTINVSCGYLDVIFAVSEWYPFTVAGDPVVPQSLPPTTTTTGVCGMCITPTTTSTTMVPTTTAPTTVPPARPVPSPRITYTG